MANKKISELVPLNATPAANDILPLNDTSQGTTFSVKVSELQAATQSLASNLTDISTIAQANGTMIASDGTNFVSLGAIDSTGLSEIRGDLGLGTAATTASADYATAAQGAKADSALQSGEEAVQSVAGKTGTVSLFKADISDLVLGTAATLDVGVSIGNVVQLSANNTLPILDGSNLTGVGGAAGTVSESTTARTLSNSDNGKVIVCTNASTITVTIPSTLTAGFSCKLVQGGAGIVGVSAGSGTTLSSIGGKAFTSGQYQVVDLINYATNAYVLDSNNLQTDPAAWSGNTYSISLDGVSDYASMTQTDLSAGARSWSFWYKFSSTGSGIKGIWGSDTYNRYLGVDAGTGYFYVNDGAALAYFNTGITFNTTDWYHAVLTDNGSGALNFYANGASKTVTGNQNQGAWRIKYIGRYVGASTIYFPGKIDEVAYFDYTLSSSQATNIYKGEDDGGSGGTNGTAGDLSTFGPEHWWRMGDFEGGTGSSVTDQGGASSTLDLTLNGASFAADAP